MQSLRESEPRLLLGLGVAGSTLLAVITVGTRWNVLCSVWSSAAGDDTLVSQGVPVAILEKERCSMGDVADVYDDTRTKLSDLVLGLDDGDQARQVPACPAWSIKDLIAHVTGVAEACVRATFRWNWTDGWGEPGAAGGFDEWTAGHVSSRADISLKEILDEWSEHSSVVTSMMRGETPWPEGAPPFADRIVVTDIGAHQQDIYGALGIVADREGPAVKIGSSSYIGGLDLWFRSQGLPALGVDAGERQWVAGDGEPAATVRASRFELFRALSGRRSPEQLRKFAWEGDPEPFLPYFYPYGPRTDAIVE